MNKWVGTHEEVAQSPLGKGSYCISGRLQICEGRRLEWCTSQWIKLGPSIILVFIVGAKYLMYTARRKVYFGSQYWRFQPMAGWFQGRSIIVERYNWQGKAAQLMATGKRRAGEEPERKSQIQSPRSWPHDPLRYTQKCALLILKVSLKPIKLQPTLTITSMSSLVFGLIQTVKYRNIYKHISMHGLLCTCISLPCGLRGPWSKNSLVTVNTPNAQILVFNTIF